MITLKGAIFGTILFVFVAIGYIALRMKMLSDANPRPAGTQIGITPNAITHWTLTDPMFWIMFVACITLCSFLLHAFKARG
jgi:hypothetical protein